MLKSEGIILNRFYLIEAEETEALTKIVQVYTKNSGLITLYVRDIFTYSDLFGKLELFDKINFWWESAKDLANLVDIIDYKRPKSYTYENFMGLSYMAKIIKDDIKLSDETIYDLFSYFWEYDFGKNFYIPAIWFVMFSIMHMGFSPMFLDSDLSKSPDTVGINPYDGSLGFSKYSIKTKKIVLEILKTIANTDLEDIKSLRFSMEHSKEAFRVVSRLFKGLNR